MVTLDPDRDRRPRANIDGERASAGMVVENDETVSPAEPSAKPSLLDVLETMDDLDEDFPEIADPPPEPVDPFSSEPSSAAPLPRR